MTVRTFAAAAAAAVLLHVAPALAADACGSMRMPAAQLKTVGRGLSRWHAGIDLMAPYGSPVRAAAPGRVVYEGRYFGYGNMIDIEHTNGVITRYAHLSAYAGGVHMGSTVSAGETIGAVGTSGLAHGSHLHFEVRINGRPVDPKPYISLSDCTPREPAIEEAQAPEPRAPQLAEGAPAPGSLPAQR